METSGKLDKRPVICLLSLFFLWLHFLRGQVPSGAQPYSCLESVYALLESVVILGSPTQWMVALLGLCLYPALSRTGRSVVSRPETGPSSSPSTQASTRTSGPGSHSIEVERQDNYRRHGRGVGSGLLKRLRRVLSEGRAKARRLCGRDSALHTSVPSFSRKRSFGSRSSKSEDVLSSRLSSDSALRAATHTQASGSGAGSGRRGLLFQRRGSGSSIGGGGGAGGVCRWQPSMTRIASGQHLAGMAPSESSLSSAAAGKRLEILSYTGFQAVDCLSHEMTDPAFAAVRQVITDTYLLQFGALIGEASAELALSQASSPGPVGQQPGSLFGPYDRKDLYRQGWEPVVEEHKPGLHYWSWRRPLRKGLFMYKSKTVYEAATTAQLIDFTYDMDFRRTWDDIMVCQIAIPPPAAVGTPAAAAAAAAGVTGEVVGAGAAGAARMSLAEADAKSAGGRSAFMYARTKFPPPMAARDYTYVRRSWAKPDDGGCYCISRDFAHPAPPATGGRAVRVSDFISGYVIRSSKGIFDPGSPAVEAVNVYYEDAGVASGLANMGVRRALWPMVQKAETAFRDYLLTRVHGGLEQPPPERPLALDSLGAALGAGDPQAAARAAAAAADADAASCMGHAAGGGGNAPWRGLRLGSPYVLLYRAYMAVWRGGRSLVLSGLSCGMSVWCHATRLAVGALGGARSGLRASAAAAAAAPTALRRALAGARVRTVRIGSSNLSLLFGGSPLTITKSSVGIIASQAGRVMAVVMWPWEALLAAAPANRKEAVTAEAGGVSRPGSGGRGPTLTSGGGRRGGGDRPLSSHPLFSCAGGPSVAAVTVTAQARKRPSAASLPHTNSSSTLGGRSGSADGSSSPRGARAGAVRTRGGGGGGGGFVRRWAVLAVKVAKVAGAGLLLGRAASTPTSRTQAAQGGPYAGQASQTEPDGPQEEREGREDTSGQRRHRGSQSDVAGRTILPSQLW